MNSTSSSYKKSSVETMLTSTSGRRDRYCSVRCEVPSSGYARPSQQWANMIDNHNDDGDGCQSDDPAPAMDSPVAVDERLLMFVAAVGADCLVWQPLLCWLCGVRLIGTGRRLDPEGLHSKHDLSR